MFIQVLLSCSFSVLMKNKLLLLLLLPLLLLVLFLERAYFSSLLYYKETPVEQMKVQYWGRVEEGDCFANGKYFKYYILKTIRENAM